MDDHQGDENMHALLQDLINASKIPAKRRGLPIKPTVERLTSLSYDRGALPDELQALVGLITTPNHLDHASMSAIVRNLYPIGKVPDQVALSIVGALGHGQLRPSLTIQSLLLRWLILVYHFLESREVLSKCYSVLFNLLDTATISHAPQTCQTLQDTINVRTHGYYMRHDPSLVGLLRVYKNYYPDVIVGDATRGKASPFKYPDTEWRKRLEEIQISHQRQRKDRDLTHSATRDGFNVKHRFGVQGGLVPSVQTSHANEESVTLDEIDSASQFVKHLEKIELPNQLVAVLADPLLQKLLLLRPDSGADARIGDWLEACISDAEESAFVDGGSALLDLLEVVQDHAAHTKILHPIYDDLMRKIYPVWNGKDRIDIVLATLTYVPVQSFGQLHKRHLASVESKIANSSGESQVLLLDFYRTLLQRWAVAMLSRDAGAPVTKGAPGAIAALITHVGQLSSNLLQANPTVASCISILSFYDQVARLFARPQLIEHIPISAPGSSLIYNLAFSDSPAIFSILCNVLACYKRGLEVATATAGSSQRRKVTRQEREHVLVFNSFFMDICNLVWRGRAFEKQGDNARGCMLEDDVIATLEDWAASQEGGDRKALRNMYGISRAPVLCSLSAEFFRGLEEAELSTGGVSNSEPALLVRHAGPVSQQSLAQLKRDGGLDISWQEYRLGVLNELGSQGLGGLSALLFQAIKSLGQQAASQSQNQDVS
ncbi:hypothetical protein PspLS_02599 [Pyricularia sp. CBS 133598]|nr:hypothetical protein PspLS_02599 [Pyricularia sp. CBS 133598]